VSETAEKKALYAEIARLQEEALAHDRRVAELLEANSREVERRREAERKLAEAKAVIFGYFNGPSMMMSTPVGAQPVNSVGMRALVDEIIRLRRCMAGMKSA
jgi:hypothetical protein